MNKINLSFILKSIIIVAITATEQCSGTQCDLSRRSCRSLSSCVSLLQRQTESEETAHSCAVLKSKCWTRRLGLGKITCTEKGVHRKSCQHIHKYNCSMHTNTIGKPRSREMLPYGSANWKNMDTGNIRLVYSRTRTTTPYILICFQHLILIPVSEFLLFILVISMLACVSVFYGGHKQRLCYCWVYGISIPRIVVVETTILRVPVLGRKRTE